MKQKSLLTSEMLRELRNNPERRAYYKSFLKSFAQLCKSEKYHAKQIAVIRNTKNKLVLDTLPEWLIRDLHAAVKKTEDLLNHINGLWESYNNQEVSA